MQDVQHMLKKLMQHVNQYLLNVQLMELDVYGQMIVRRTQHKNFAKVFFIHMYKRTLLHQEQNRVFGKFKVQQKNVRIRFVVMHLDLLKHNHNAITG